MRLPNWGKIHLTLRLSSETYVYSKAVGVQQGRVEGGDTKSTEYHGEGGAQFTDHCGYNRSKDED